MDEAEQANRALDFGSGNIVVMASRCLRIAKMPTDCTACAEVCPAHALALKPLEEEAQEQAAQNTQDTPDTQGADAATPTASKDTTEEQPAAKATPVKFSRITNQGVEATEACIHCGLCITSCPTEALTATKHHPKGLEKQLTEKMEQAEGIAVGCARAFFGLSPRLTVHAITLPCLAAVGAEGWYLAAALAAKATFEAQFGQDESPQKKGSSPDLPTASLKVFLPPFLCTECPINASGQAEALYMAAISDAEAWGAANIELVSNSEELRFSSTGGFVTSLGDVSAAGKRELVEQLAAGFGKTWKNAGENMAKEKLRAEQLAKRRKKAQRTATKPIDHNAPRPFGKKSFKRRLLKAAMEQDEALIPGVELVITATDTQCCTGCGTCVAVCSLNARHLYSSNSVLYFGKLPEEERPKGKEAAVCDQLCCLGCSACVLQCPTDACTLSLLDGTSFNKLRQN